MTTACSSSEVVVKATSCEDDGINMMTMNSFIIRGRSQSILPWWWRRVAGCCFRQRRSGSGQRLDCCHWCPAEWCLLWHCNGPRCIAVHLWRSAPLCWPWSTIESITIKMFHRTKLVTRLIIWNYHSLCPWLGGKPTSTRRFIKPGEPCAKVSSD